MPKDRDRNLIDKWNRALTIELHEMLEKVLKAELKPLILRLTAVEKEQKKQSRAIRKLQETVDVAIRLFDAEDVRLHKRIKRIETHLDLPEVI